MNNNTALQSAIVKLAQVGAQAGLTIGDWRRKILVMDKKAHLSRLGFATYAGILFNMTEEESSAIYDDFGLSILIGLEPATEAELREQVKNQTKEGLTLEQAVASYKQDVQEIPIDREMFVDSMMDTLNAPANIALAFAIACGVPEKLESENASV